MASGRVISYLIVNGVKTPIGFSSQGVGVISLETKDLDLGDRRREKFLDALVFRFDDDAHLESVTFRVGLRQHLHSDIVWSDPVLIAGAGKPNFVDVEEARFYRLKIEDSVPSGQWKLQGIDFYGRMMGGRL